jgi:hypothetical protein
VYSYLQGILGKLRTGDIKERRSVFSYVQEILGKFIIEDIWESTTESIDISEPEVIEDPQIKVSVIGENAESLLLHFHNTVSKATLAVAEGPHVAAVRETEPERTLETSKPEVIEEPRPEVVDEWKSAVGSQLPRHYSVRAKLLSDHCAKYFHQYVALLVFFFASAGLPLWWMLSRHRRDYKDPIGRMHRKR